MALRVLRSQLRVSSEDECSQTVSHGWVIDGKAWRTTIHPFRSAEEQEQFVAAVERTLSAQTFDADAERAQRARAEGLDYRGDSIVPEAEPIAACLACQAWGGSESDQERGGALLYDLVGGEDDSLSQIAAEWDRADDAGEIDRGDRTDGVPQPLRTLTLSTEAWRTLQGDLIQRGRLYLQAQDLEEKQTAPAAIAKVHEEIDDVHGAIAQKVAAAVDTHRVRLEPGREADRLGPHPVERQFPFEVLAFLGEDGQPVVEIATGGPERDKFQDSRGEPYLRVWVNDYLCSKYSGPEPWRAGGMARLAARILDAAADGRNPVKNR